jgi:hypothetical protein
MTCNGTNVIHQTIHIFKDSIIYPLQEISVMVRRIGPDKIGFIDMADGIFFKVLIFSIDIEM